VLILVAGCGPGSAGPEVKGKVTLEDGKPLTVGTVIFHPDEAKGNKSTVTARGALNDSGEYHLKQDGGGKTGVSVGWYKVAVQATKLNPKDEYATPVWLIPERFGDPGTSKLSVEVVAGASADAYQIKVASK
jgi:hypothetical protein